MARTRRSDALIYACAISFYVFAGIFSFIIIILFMFLATVPFMLSTKLMFVCVYKQKYRQLAHNYSLDLHNYSHMIIGLNGNFRL